MYYSRFHSAIGDIILVGDEQGLQRLYIAIEQAKHDLPIAADWQEDRAFFAEAQSQIQAYLAGELQQFKLKLNPQGTVFQQKVWQQLQQIPYGTCCSYKALAQAVGNAKASRAVGTANGKNPIPLIIPCHRVIGSNGKLSGFAFGEDLKRQLLQLEAAL